MYTPVGVLSGVCRDPDDDVILLCAAEIQADFLVTGDKDLLELKVYQNFQILSPSNFELLFDD
jgi:predicted nucleic acid-binding protein